MPTKTQDRKTAKLSAAVLGRALTPAERKAKQRARDREKYNADARARWAEKKAKGLQ